MQTATRQIIEHCFATSHNGTADFGYIVKSLMDAGVESYQADYRAHKTLYYLPDGECLSLDLPPTNKVIADAFDANALKEAIKGAQRGEVKYPEFKELSQAAGCVGYFVWISGRHVTYLGRRGETHVEHFPSGK